MPIFVRKSITKKKKVKQNKLLDFFVDAAVIIAPLSLLPQLYSVWVNGSAAGVSLATWLLTFLITVPLIAYDMNHKALKLVFMHSLIATISLGIVIGILVAN